MASRIAAVTSLVAFALCLVMGIAADNPFSTVLSRALGALVVTLVLGLVLGAMGQKMIDENVKRFEKNRDISESKPGASDR